MAEIKPLFQHLDCLEFYAPDLQKGVEYYRDKLGLKILWKTETAIGLGMADGITEIVIQNEPISDVKFVDIRQLEQYGFSSRWRDLVLKGFPDAPGYVGLKENIGL